MGAKEADAYLAKLSADKRATLEKVRKAIRAAAPDAEEGIGYGMPAFVLKKPIAGYAASADHCSYFPMSGAITAQFADELNGYEVSKGGFRFPVGKPPPAALIRKLVQARLAEIDGVSAKSASAKKPAKADVAAVLAEIKRSGSPAYKADMAKRYGIVTTAPVYGLAVGTLRDMAKRLGPDHALAEALWKSGVHDARMLAPMVDNPAEVTPAQMERWVKDCDNWALVDTACFHYWDRTPHAAKQIEKWSSAKGEFVKRAAFALMASRALHKHSTEADQLKGLGLIAREAHDERNFVKKAVSWALRSIGGRGSAKVKKAARDLAKRLAASEDAAERWVGKDALREFNKKDAL